MDPPTISDKTFHELIAKRAQTLLGLASYLANCESVDAVLTRPFLGEFLSQSVQIEELLDAYDARNNCQWCVFRSLTAATKLFSDVSYELLHIQHALPAYRLLPIEHDFVQATQQTLDFTGRVLSRAAKQILVKAEQLELPVPSQSLRTYSEELPPGRLPHDCAARRTETVAETVTLLATAFLNLAADSKRIRAAGKAKPEEYASYAAESVTEENLRNLELRFHNLQSLYDTFVSGTEVETLDKDLPVLRGQISIVFHLLRLGTRFAHYYERHVNKQQCALAATREPLVEADALLWQLMTYCTVHIGLYIACAEKLCQNMLKRYAQVGRIEVPVPSYRGFHVRPSTLVSTLVLHYGSDVRMELANETYNAASPLDLFRANEKINAEKRRWLAAEIAAIELNGHCSDQSGTNAAVQSVVLRLVQKSKLILYEQPLQMPEESAQQEGTLLQRITDKVGQLLALGKIDINIDLTASFVGDKRVLSDIKLLAEAGYGEDQFGNNIPLPEELVYLRH
ncbi:MAG: hypothetical protein JW720_01300 [Sedimentisphaerales bacterium]|nr:hypothetical protein [Sedimentisphaerales bacterium]